MIIGLTGGIGSGKSTVSKILKSYGFVIIDSDKLSRETVKKGSSALGRLTKAFGADILTKDGRLNRRALAAKAFSDDKAYKKLVAITQKAILDLAKEKFQKNKDKDIVFEVPLLFESGWDKYCDKTISVAANKAVRLERVCKRDNLDKKSIEDRMARQLTDKERNAKADIVINNNGSEEDLEKQIVKKLNLKG